MGSRGLVEATREMQEPLVRSIISFQGEQLTIVNGVVPLSSSTATPRWKGCVDGYDDWEMSKSWFDKSREISFVSLASVKQTITMKCSFSYCGSKINNSHVQFYMCNNCERFEPRSHFRSRLSLIVRVNVVLNRSVVVDSDWRFDNLCGSHLQSQNELYHVSWWYYTLVIDLIGQIRRDVIVRLSVKPWCYRLWRLVISNWCVSIRLLSQLNSRLLLVKLSVLCATILYNRNCRHIYW